MIGNGSVHRLVGRATQHPESGNTMYMTPEEFPDAEIESGAVIERGAQIGRGAVIGVNRKGVTHALVINGIGTTRRMTAHTSEDGLVIVIGCLNDYQGVTIEQARKAIAQKYSPDHAYFAALDLAQRWYDQLEYTNTN